MLLLGFAPNLALGQSSQTGSAADEAGARIEANFGVTAVHDAVTGFWGGTVLVGFGNGFWIGGAGHASRKIEYDTPTGRAQAGLGYGGLVLELDVLSRSGGLWSGALLLGGGNADVTDPLVGVELGSDNFFVVHPSLRFARGVQGPLRVSGEAGYRFAFGVQDLPGLDGGDLSGFTLGLSVGASRR